MLALFLFALFVVLLIIGVIGALRGSYGIGVLALIFGALLFGPQLAQKAYNNARGIDLETTHKGGKVEVRNQGPIAFTHRSRSNPYGDRTFTFVTEVDLPDGPEAIAFSIWDVRDYRAPNYSSDCREELGPDGLRELFTSDEELPSTSAIRCTGSTIQQRIFRSDPGDGPPTRLRCSISAEGHTTACTMRVHYAGLELNVFLLDLPAELWRPARAHVMAVVDQSFSVVVRT